MEKSQGVEIVLSDLEKNPSCPHGPTLLFKRISKGTELMFYACAGCRDRKDCNFFLKFGDEWTVKKQEQWNRKTSLLLPKIDHSELMKRYLKVSELPSENRSYCQTCALLLYPEEASSHLNHDVTNEVSNHQLTHPSELLKPIESAKKEAQYLFANKSTEVIVGLLRNAGVKNVLCVGAPRIHEHIRNVYGSDMKSMLLDFDHRYHQFSKRAEFAWFNSFNCHWLAGEEGKSVFLQFLSQPDSKELALVTDPPFGGRVEPLAHTFKCLDGLHKDLHANRKRSIWLMWIFPYFMEPMIKNSCPDMCMLDYKVDYDNHPLFQQGERGRKYGSPVRIFTNISPAILSLPEDEGYQFCTICERWVSSENRHCFKCSSCTSKDGRTYVHCDKCSRCVKPTWQHCRNCKRCCLPDHKCGNFQPSGCFACQAHGHKKNDCPLRNNEEAGANRIRFKRKQKHGSSVIKTSCEDEFADVSSNKPRPKNLKRQIPHVDGKRRKTVDV